MTRIPILVGLLASCAVHAPRASSAELHLGGRTTLVPSMAHWHGLSLGIEAPEVVGVETYHGVFAVVGGGAVYAMENSVYLFSPTDRHGARLVFRSGFGMTPFYTPAVEIPIVAGVEFRNEDHGVIVGLSGGIHLLGIHGQPAGPVPSFSISIRGIAARNP